MRLAFVLFPLSVGQRHIDTCKIISYTNSSRLQITIMLEIGSDGKSNIHIITSYPLKKFAHKKIFQGKIQQICTEHDKKIET